MIMSSDKIKIENKNKYRKTAPFFSNVFTFIFLYYSFLETIFKIKLNIRFRKYTVTLFL